MYKLPSLYFRHYSYPITVEVSPVRGRKRSHLFRSFETVLQKPPNEYLTAFRIKQASYLLEHSSLSVAAVANSVGFDNGLYFSKTFRKAVGMAPRDFRQMKQAQEPKQKGFE